MADHRHHGEGEHRTSETWQMPPMPGSALVVIEPEANRFSAVSKLSSIATPMAFAATSVSMDVARLDTQVW